MCYIAGFGDPEIEYLPRLMDTKTIGKMYICEWFQRPISGVQLVIANEIDAKISF